MAPALEALLTHDVHTGFVRLTLPCKTVKGSIDWFFLGTKLWFVQKCFQGAPCIHLVSLVSPCIPGYKGGGLRLVVQYYHRNVMVCHGAGRGWHLAARFAGVSSPSEPTRKLVMNRPCDAQGHSGQQSTHLQVTKENENEPRTPPT